MKEQPAHSHQRSATKLIMLPSIATASIMSSRSPSEQQKRKKRTRYCALSQATALCAKSQVEATTTANLERTCGTFSTTPIRKEAFKGTSFLLYHVLSFLLPSFSLNAESLFFFTSHTMLASSRSHTFYAHFSCSNRPVVHSGNPKAKNA